MTTNTKGWFISETVYSPQHQSPFFMHIKSNERINTLEEHTPETSFKPPPIGYGAPKFVDQHFSFNLLHICIHRLKFNFLRTENLNFFFATFRFRVRDSRSQNYGGDNSWVCKDSGIIQQ